MSYSNDTISKAKQTLKKRKEKAEHSALVRKVEATARIPKLAEYDEILSSAGLSVAKAIGMGADIEEHIRQISEINLSVQAKVRQLLKENGYPEDYLEIKYTCPKCSDTGFDGIYFCECYKNLLKEIALDNLASVSTSANCTFENFDLGYYPLPVDPDLGISPRNRMTALLEYCKCYADDFDCCSESLYMHGATGLGKTHLSLAIANEVTKKGYQVIYDTAQNIFSSLEKEKFSYGNTFERENEILNCDLLIIDDLGSEFITNFTTSALYNIINTRINRSKPVIISTNLTEEELEAKYTQRVTSRIIGNYASLLFVGKDIRQLKRMK